jgi:2-dehydro-3-deoxygluconokinase
MAIIAFGELLLRLHTPEQGDRLGFSKQLEVGFAGAESNVLAGLSLLGHATRFVSVLPKNAWGDGALANLRSFGVDVSHVQRSEGRMGTYFIESGTSIRAPKVVYDRKQSVFSLLNKGAFPWEEIFAEGDWLHVTGITPALSQSCALETVTAVKKAKALGAKVSFDLNYRRSLWKQPKEAKMIFDEILAHTDLLFGNVGGLKDVYGANFGTEDAREESLQGLRFVHRNFQIPIVAFTQRQQFSANENNITALCSVNGSVHETADYAVEVIDRLGTGDAFVAAYLHGLLQQWDPQKTLDFAAASCALKHTLKGDVQLATEDEIMDIAAGKTQGYIKR